MAKRGPISRIPLSFCQMRGENMQDYLLIGTVLKPQGIHGECKIKSYAAEIGRFRKWKTLYLRSPEGWSPVACRVVRIGDGCVYATLNGSENPDQAEAFRGADLYVDRAQVAPPSGNSVLIADLIGCEAQDESGARVGVLTEVLQHGPVDTWVFRTETGTLMAPALLAVFPEVDTSSGRITVCADRLREVAVYAD